MVRFRRCRCIALSLSIALAGCGGGGDDKPPATTTSNGAVTATCGAPRFVEETLERVNTVRARGADCGVEGVFAPAPPLAWNDALTAAAAAHSSDMATRNYFAHVSPEGVTLGQRVSAAGYRWSALAENIAAGYGSIAAVVDGWVDSDGHCANLMNPALRDLGMACVPSSTATYRSYWTMDLGRQP